MTINGIIDSKEKRWLDKKGLIQLHNGNVVNNFENIIFPLIKSDWDYEFYRKLQEAVAKNELSKDPLASSIIFVAFSVFFIIASLCFGLSFDKSISILILPLYIFCRFTYKIIKECSKLNRVKKSLNIKENIYSVSIKIDGICSYTVDTDNDDINYYIRSETMLICVPKRIYDSAFPGNNLIGAVVQTENQRYFYALNVV